MRSKLARSLGDLKIEQEKPEFQETLKNLSFSEPGTFSCCNPTPLGHLSRSSPMSSLLPLLFPHSFLLLSVALPGTKGVQKFNALLFSRAL